jgi:capsular exopolysaccharide synthesis family protein
MEDQLNVRRYLLVIRHWWWLILGCTILAALAAFIVSSQMMPVYSASVTLLVHQSPSSSGNDYNALLTSEKLARTYAQMLTGRPVLDAVIEQLGLDETREGLAGRIDTELVQNTQLIRLGVEDTNPTQAAQLANAVASEFIIQNQALQQGRYADSLGSIQEQMDEMSSLMERTQAEIDALGTPETPQMQAELTRLETVLAGYRNTYASLLQSYEQMRLTAVQSADNVIVFEEAQTPDAPIRPRKVMNTALAGALGMMMAVGVVFLVEYLDNTIKTPEDVSQELGLGTMGVIGRLAKGSEELVTVAHPLSPVSEAFRVLRTNIRFSGVDKPIRTLLVTSAGPTEGKSTTAANLAVAMAQAGLKVVVLDADLRRPRLHQIFGLHPRGGLTGSLLEGNMDGRLQPSQVEGLTVLPAGERPPNPSELLGSRRLRELLDELAGGADVVVIDSPPVLPVTDAAVLAQEVDGVLLVVDAGETRRDVVQRAAESLQQVGAHLIGVVLNRVSTGRGGYYYHYYQQYYDDNGYQKQKRRKRRRTKGVLAPVQRLFREAERENE